MQRSGYRTVRALFAAVLAVIWAGVAAAQQEITVIVNDVEAEPISGEAAYQVTAHITVADSGGQLIEGLTADDFAIHEDGDPVPITSADYVVRSAAVVLVLDTSGSMSRDNTMVAVCEAAAGFIGSLGEGDQVGVIYFNDIVIIGQNLSDDLQAAESIVGLLEAELGAGTCLYDAAYDAVTMAAGAPPGQRAVVLFTDGVDERGDSDEPCSAHTADDVIDLARSGVIRVPIYTIGLGDTINAGELSRIAENTGGHSLVAPGAADVAALFQAIADQLKNQYALTYRSEAAGGQHEFSATITIEGTIAIGTSNFVAPLITVLNLSGLDDGAILDGMRTIRATASGADVVRVIFELDGETLSEVTSPPYEATLDSASIAGGEHELAATAVLEDGTVLTESLRFGVTATEDVTAVEAEGRRTLPSGLPAWVLPVGIGGGAVLLAGIVVGVFFLTRKKATAGAVGYVSSSDMTTDIRLGPTLATLTVEESLSLRHGQRFDLTRDVSRLGRGVENDIVVPDAPVSRNHAEIHFRAGAFQVFDNNSTYGTFVNDTKVGLDGHPILHGDVLRLGTRTRMTFTTPQPAGAGPEDKTMDIHDSSDEFKTAKIDD